jgi:hypothetical protein
MKDKNMKKIVRSFLSAVTVVFILSGSLTEAHEDVQGRGITMDAIGEFLRTINVLSGGTRTLPSGDPFVENIRARFEIPERIPIFSPHGGDSIIVFVFDSERLPVGRGLWHEIFPSEYKYLQTYHNLKAVYCLHEKEPVDLGDIVFAVQPDQGGHTSVFFNNKRGTVDLARIKTGNSIFFPGSRYIVKPVGVESQL